MFLRDVIIALPEKTVSSETISQWTGLGVDFIKNKIGIENRHFLGADETVLELTVKACEKLFERHGSLKPENIDIVVLITQNPDYKIPHTSALIQDALSLPENTACFDINLGCSGFVYGLSIIKAFMVAENIPNGLLITCDPYSKIMSKTDRDTVPIFGDGATATWMSSESGASIGSGVFGTDGSGGKNLTVKAGGSANPHLGIWNDSPATYNPKDESLHMDGRAIFNFMMKRIPESVGRCLSKNNLSRDDIDFFVFHQASFFLIKTLIDHMHLDPEKVPCNLKNVGNTVSSTIPMILSEMMESGRLEGKKAVVSGFGVGLSWATNVIEFQEKI